jgi:flavodoxin
MEVSMKVLIVYDSLFGNTEKIAHTVHGELSKTTEVKLARAAALPRLTMNDLDLLLVGGPTHRQTMSDAVAKLIQATPAAALQGIPVATFDTSYDMPRWLRVASGGTAANKILRGLRKLGALRLASPKSFLIEHNHEGPLMAGELEKAERWAASLAEKLVLEQPVGSGQRLERAV